MTAGGRPPSTLTPAGVRAASLPLARDRSPARHFRARARRARRVAWRHGDTAEPRARADGPGAARSRLAPGSLPWLPSSRSSALIVAGWTVLAFLPALRNGFVDWDDGRMFLENPHHRGSWAMRMRGAWATHLLGEYMPVTWTSYALDRALWDLDARGYHLTSLGLARGDHPRGVRGDLASF